MISQSGVNLYVFLPFFQFFSSIAEDLIESMKKGLIYSLLLPGILIGIFLAFHFGTASPLGGPLPSDEVESRDALIKDFLDEQGYLQSKIVSLRNEIESAQGEISIQSEEYGLSVLEKLKEDIGLTEKRGTGLSILLDDSPSVSRDALEVSDHELIQASDLRDVVNLLRAAGAEAISVNSQRVIATTPISSVGTTILINNVYITPPFNINAVGDKDVLLQRVLNKELLPSLYEKGIKNNIIFEIALKDMITIPVYNGDIKANYLNLIN